MKFSEIQIFLNFHMPNIFGKVKPTNGWTNLNTIYTKKLWLQEFKKYKFSSSLLCFHLYQVTFRFITIVCMILNHCELRCINWVVKSKKFLTPHFFLLKWLLPCKNQPMNLRIHLRIQNWGLRRPQKG